MNEGVGGSLHVVIINPDQAKHLSTAPTLAMARLSAEYLSETEPNILSREKVREFFSGIMLGQGSALEDIAKIIGTSANQLVSDYIPYSEIQARNNRKAFGQF